MTRVLAAWVHEDHVTHTWMMSLMGVASATTQATLDYLAVPGGTGDLAHARDIGAAKALDQGFDYLWWTDTDAGYKPNTLDRLLRAADPEHRPIVGALAHAMRTEDDGMNGYRTWPVPTLYRVQDDHNGDPPRFVEWDDVPPNACVPVDGTGSHCILIHRSVLEAVGPGPYQRIRLVGNQRALLVGEDLSFCMRATTALGPGKIWVHTGIRTTHYKGQWL